MRKSVEERRLNAIKLKFCIIPRLCASCSSEVYFEKMWRVKRYSGYNQEEEFCYCQQCMKSVKEVLNSIYTDPYSGGIVGVDERTKPGVNPLATTPAPEAPGKRKNLNNR